LTGEELTYGGNKWQTRNNPKQTDYN
jgi:hypothetical protein